jgi:hypothetical protein
MMGETLGFVTSLAHSQHLPSVGSNETHDHGKGDCYAVGYPLAKLPQFLDERNMRPGALFVIPSYVTRALKVDQELHIRFVAAASRTLGLPCDWFPKLKCGIYRMLRAQRLLAWSKPRRHQPPTS